jgi:hypothetical protein
MGTGGIVPHIANLAASYSGRFNPEKERLHSLDNAGFEVITRGYEELYLPGCRAVWSVESNPTFLRNLSPPSSGWSKNKSSKKAT